MHRFTRGEDICETLPVGAGEPPQPTPGPTTPPPPHTTAPHYTTDPHQPTHPPPTATPSPGDDNHAVTIIVVVLLVLIVLGGLATCGFVAYKKNLSIPGLDRIQSFINPNYRRMADDSNMVWRSVTVVILITIIISRSVSRNYHPSRADEY